MFAEPDELARKADAKARRCRLPPDEDHSAVAALLSRLSPAYWRVGSGEAHVGDGDVPQHPVDPVCLDRWMSFAERAGFDVVFGPRHADAVVQHNRARLRSFAVNGAEYTRRSRAILSPGDPAAFWGSERDVAGGSRAHASGLRLVRELGQRARSVAAKEGAIAWHALFEHTPTRTHGLVRNRRTLEVNADLYAALLWKRLMGPRVMSVAEDGADAGNEGGVSAYAHCSDAARGIAVALVNVGDAPVAVHVRVPAGGGSAYFVYDATAAPGSSRSASSVRSAPVPVRLGEDDAEVAATLDRALRRGPQLRHDGVVHLTLAASSYVFVELPGMYPACTAPAALGARTPASSRRRLADGDGNGGTPMSHCANDGDDGEYVTFPPSLYAVAKNYTCNVRKVVMLLISRHNAKFGMLAGMMSGGQGWRLNGFNVIDENYFASKALFPFNETLSNDLLHHVEVFSKAGTRAAYLAGMIGDVVNSPACTAATEIRHTQSQTNGGFCNTSCSCNSWNYSHQDRRDNMFGHATEKVWASGTIAIGGCYHADASICPWWFVSENVQLLANEIRTMPTTGVNALSMIVLNRYLKGRYEEAFTTFALIYSLWDGIGFRENAAILKGNYFTRTCAFFLYIVKATGYPVPQTELDVMEHYMWNAQVADGNRGMKASYAFTGVATDIGAPSSTETNSQVLLNYDPRIDTWFPLKQQGLRPTPAPTSAAPTQASSVDGNCVMEYGIRYGSTAAADDLGCTSDGSVPVCCKLCEDTASCASWSLGVPSSGGASQCCLSSMWRKEKTAVYGYVSGYVYERVWKTLPPTMHDNIEFQLDAQAASWSNLAEGAAITSDWISSGHRDLTFVSEGTPRMTKTPSGGAAVAFDGSSAFNNAVCNDCERGFFNFADDMGTNPPMTVFIVVRPRALPTDCFLDSTPASSRFMGHDSQGQFRFYQCRPSAFMSSTNMWDKYYTAENDEWVVAVYRNHLDVAAGGTANRKRVDMGTDKGMWMQWSVKNKNMGFSANRKLFVGSTKSISSLQASGGTGFVGDIAELLVFNTTLEDVDVNSVTMYLHGKHMWDYPPPTGRPTTAPTLAPTAPTSAPTKMPTTTGYTYAPSVTPTSAPTLEPSAEPTAAPSTGVPTSAPTASNSTIDNAMAPPAVSPAAVVAVVFGIVVALLLVVILAAGGAVGLIIFRRHQRKNADVSETRKSQRLPPSLGIAPPPMGSDDLNAPSATPMDGIELVAGTKTYSVVNPLAAMFTQVESALAARERSDSRAPAVPPIKPRKPVGPSVAQRLAKLRVASRTLGKSERVRWPTPSTVRGAARRPKKSGAGKKMPPSGRTTPPHLRVKGSALLKFKKSAPNAARALKPLKKMRPLLSLQSMTTSRPHEPNPKPKNGLSQRESDALSARFRNASRSINSTATAASRLYPLPRLASLTALQPLQPLGGAAVASPLSNRANRLSVAQRKPTAPHLMSSALRRASLVKVQMNPLNRVDANRISARLHVHAEHHSSKLGVEMPEATEL